MSYAKYAFTPTCQNFALNRLVFYFAFACAPILTHFLYKYKMGKAIRNNGNTPIFTALHLHKAGTPTMGGVLIWGTLIILSPHFIF